MTGGEKYGWGVGLTVTGSVLFIGGIALSMTLIGACLGVPMAIVGFPLLVWGFVWAYQGHAQRQQEVISAGIRDGLRQAQAPPQREVASQPLEREDT